MEVAVALQYPNGRTVETVISRDKVLQRGTEFEMYGHTWRAVALLDSRRPNRLTRKVDPKEESTRILCVRAD